ncbi:MAG: protein kinase [Verrucomicrobiales bacterium]|nr:protein kinase [Verrucomicrobiales bacterium]
MNRSAAILAAAAGSTHAKRLTTKHIVPFQPAAAWMAARRGPGRVVRLFSGLVPYCRSTVSRARELTVKPPVIPDHTLIRPIGRGAYGEVWLARNVMGALRAVKIIWRRQFESDRPFEREFEGIQRYEPVSRSSGGLVHVLHVGRNDPEGYFYYVMELAEGAEARVISNQYSVISKPVGHQERGSAGLLNTDSLITDYSPRTLRADLKRLGRLPTADCLRLALEVASGLGQLHRHGLVHRDVKPGNIIYVNGRAKLADIGLVTANGEGRTFVGTEGYIPPEGPGSPTADLYALGLVLYEASTGLPPERFPDVPPSWFNAATGDDPLELYEVILKACEGQRERRYQSAEELQADLALLQSGESVRHMRALKRRYARLRASLLVGTTLLVGAFAAVFFANYRARLAAESRARETALRLQAQQSLTRAEAAEQQAVQQLYTALLEQARATVRSGELGQRVQALDAIRRAAAISNTVELRREALAALARPDLRFEQRLPTGLDCSLVALDPKFERLALARGIGPVEIHSVPDLRVLVTLPASTNRAATFGCWSQDGRFLALRRTEGLFARPTGEVWDVASARCVLLLPQTRWVSFSFHPRLAQIVAGVDEDSVALWDLETGQILKRFSMGGSAQLIEFSSNGEKFAVERQAGTKWITSVFEAESGAESKTVIGPRFNSISWDLQDRWVALTANNEIHLHDQKTGETRLVGRHKREARSAVFSPDGDYLFTGGDEQEIICWNLRSMERAFSVGLQSAQIQFRHAGLGCAVTTSREILLHSFERPIPHRELTGELGGGVSHAVISANRQWLAAGGRERLGLWDLSDSSNTSSPAVFIDARNPTPFFSPNCSELFAFWNDGFARWQINLKSGAGPNLTPLPVYKPSRIYSAGFASDTLLLGLPDGAMHVPAANISDGPGTLKNVGYADGQISPNGAWFALRKASQGYVAVHNVNPWSSLKNVPCDSQVLAVSFTPQNDELVIATFSSVTFLDTATWEERRRFPVALDRNARLLFAPDGSFWLVHNARLSALHDTRTFETRLALPPGALPLAVSPDGRHLAVSPDTRRVQVWDLAQIRANLKELGLDWVDNR